jgi:hypothetical protein
MKCRWNRTMLNLYGIVMAILKMATARNFSMSGIYSGHHNLPTYEMSCVFKIFQMSAIFTMSAKTRHKIWAVKIQHCPISSTFDMWVDYDVPNLFPTARNFSMSGIYSGHHNLPTYGMSLKSDNVEFVRYCGGWKISTDRHFQNGRHNTAKIQHCPISSKFDMWIDYDVPNLFPT